MSWTRALVLFLFSALLILTFSGGVKAASVQNEPKPTLEGVARQVFMPESDASNFFKRRGRRSVRYYEAQAEQRVKLAATERWREYNEEQKNEHENYVEEDRNELNERTVETTEQLREHHYDGLYPRFYWFH